MHTTGYILFDFFGVILQFKNDRSLSKLIKSVFSFWEILDVLTSGNVQMKR